jgi:hypothetical protein
MTINFNTKPYYDDFDPTKNFHRILFKPGYAVQARELTQSQTILQNQISNFADAIFTQNTPISGGKVTINLNCYYLKINSTNNIGETIRASNFLNKIITDPTGTILAKVITTAEQIGSDPATLIINYLSGSQFTDQTTIVPTDGTNFSAVTVGVTGENTCTGLSSIASISKGIFYVVNGYSQSSTQNSDGTYSTYSIGNFVQVNPYTTILDKYSNSPSYRIGLQIFETKYDSIDDSSLLDPAIGASNYQAPGADRYVINLNLITSSLTENTNENFIELVRIENGSVVKQVDSTVYSVIDDYFAKRTYDTNGDYIVNNFKLTPSTNPDSSKFDIRVGKGVAYVRGYRLENQSDLLLTNTRSRDTDSVNNNGVSVDYGNFFYVNTVKGSSSASFDVTTMPSIDLHVVNTANIATGGNTTVYSSTLVGKARVRNLDFDHAGSSSNTSSYVYKFSVFDIQTNVLSGVATSSSTTNTIQFQDSTGKFSASNGAYVGVTVSIDSGTSAGDFRKIIAYNGSTKTATVDTNFSVIPDTTSNFSLRFDIKDIETIVEANSSYYIVSSANIDPESKVNGLSTGDTVLQDTGYPELLFKIGNPYVASITNSTYYSTNAFRQKAFSNVSGHAELQLTFDTGISSILNFQGRTSGALSAAEIMQYYTVIVRNKGTNSTINNGDILNFTTAGRSVTVASDQNSVKFVATDLSTPLTVDIVAKVQIQSGDNTSHVLKIKNLVPTNQSNVFFTGTNVNTYTYVDLTNGQTYIRNGGIVSPGNKQLLYVSDVKRIVKIIDTGSPSVTPTLGMLSNASYDVTSYYNFNNGQTDNYYDHAYLTLKPGYEPSKGNLLVLFDRYSHSGGDGYFSLMSYLSPNSSNPEDYAQIPNYTAKNGTVYSLRDSLDFRPARVNATSNFTFEYTSDPTTTDSGSYIPTNLTSYISNYSYYLGRKDYIVLTKDKSFQIINGTSSVNPSFPTQPDGSLLVAKLTLDPFTAYIPGENPNGTLPNLSVESVQHKRWSMQDITDLQTRINNIEYYTALNSLEQRASSTQIPDVNGINRFQNGILVDDFSSFSTADTSNPDFSASINKRTRQLSAAQSVDNFPLYSQFVLNSAGNANANPASFAVNNVNRTTNIFTLPYSTTNVVSQRFASSTVNVNPFSVSIVQGVMDLNPPMDNWVDNTKSPDLLIVDPSLQVFQQSNTVNVLNTGDWKVVPGTTSTSVSQLTSSFNRVNHGAFNGPFGTVVGYTQADTTTTTQTYGTMSQTNTLGAYTNIGNTYSLNNGYITDISILPYIRPQQLLVRSKGLLVNTPVSTWFDGVNVDQYITHPDIIELTNSTGTFQEGDVIGYYQSSKFYPIATIVSAYYYPNSSTNNVRLYITGNYQTSYVNDLPIDTIQNAKYDSNGNYIRYTASGKKTKSTIITFHKSAHVGAVGGNFIDVLGTSLRYYRVWVGHGAFADAYGIWGSSNATGNLPAGKFNFTAPKSGTYYLRVSSDDAQSGYVKINGNAIWTSSLQSGGYNDFTVTLNAGTNTFEIYAVTSQDDGDAYMAVAISGSPWTSDTSTAGPIVLSTDALVGYSTPLNAGTQIEMPGGGLYYVGATQVALNGIASFLTTDGFYNGSTITFHSTYISVDVNGNVLATPQSFTANITSYTAANTTVFLDAPVNISVGGNAYIGGMDTTSSYTIDGTYKNYQLAIQAGDHPNQLSTDESGTFVGIFNIPAGTFKTGDRVFRIDNRTVPTDVTTATTFAEATFTASGLSTKSQALDFGPSVSGARNTFTQTNYLSNQLISSNKSTITSYSPYDPVAQTFIISKDNYPNGIYLNDITLFFQSKPKTTQDSITLSIVGTQNGYPNGQTLDYSIVTLTPDKVNVSTSPHYLDPNSKTTFKFQAPVYIQPGVLYAFIIKSSSTEYNLWIAGQNETAVSSTTKINPTDPNPTKITKIGTAPYVGALFESQNSITWTADQTKDMMFIINRCVFDKTKTPKIPFVVPTKLPYRKDTTGDIRYLINANNAPNLLNTYAGKDVLCDAFNMTTTDFVPTSTSVGYTYISTLVNGYIPTTESTVTPGKFGSPTYDDIYLSDGQGERVLRSNSNNSFILYSTLTSSDDSVSPIIADDGLSLYNIQWNINNLPLTNTQIVLTSGGSGYNSPTPNANVIISAPDISGGIQAVAVANVANGIVQSITLTQSGSGYLSTPTITITGANTTPAKVNVISELSPHGGNATCKYFTKKVVMTLGNDSQDLRVFYTAYRPLGTNVYVFYKLLNANDPSKFDDNNWQVMTTIGTNKNTYSSTRDDLYEFEAAPGTNGTAYNQIFYTNPNGSTYTSFIQFAIKIVMTTDDNTTVPFLTDIRAIALPSGTGL